MRQEDAAKHGVARISLQASPLAATITPTLGWSRQVRPQAYLLNTKNGTDAQLLRRF